MSLFMGLLIGMNLYQFRWWKK